jgi:hypothetical protein
MSTHITYIYLTVLSKFTPKLGVNTTNYKEVKNMPKMDWNAIEDFESNEKLQLAEVGDKYTGTFTNDGRYVKKEQLEGKSKFPRDSCILTLENKDGKRDFWLSMKSFTVLREIKALRDRNDEVLTGLKANIERISKATDATNYTFKKA